MRIKRYFAPQMREAIRKVREEQGPDAVILSSRQVDGGVEIIAAMDFDAAAAQPGTHGEEKFDRPADPGPVPEEPERPERAGSKVARSVGKAASVDPEELAAMQREIASLRELLQAQLRGLEPRGDGAGPGQARNLEARLRAFGCSTALARRLAAAVAPGIDAAMAWRQALRALAAEVPVLGDDVIRRGGVVALLGPTGGGKTATVAKLAARFALRFGRRHVALITTDRHRIGAVAQLRGFADLIGLPVHVAPDATTLAEKLRANADKRLILIDNAGFSPTDPQIPRQLALLQSVPMLKSYLVLPANLQRTAVARTVEAYRTAPLAGCVLTKLDEAVGLGAVLEQLIFHRLPVAYACGGQRVPEDLQVARPVGLVEDAARCFAAAEGSGPPAFAEAESLDHLGGFVANGYF